jgi:hypothetical protein
MSEDPKKGNIDPAFLTSIRAALEATVMDSGPPVGAPGADGSAGPVWIRVEDSLPMSLMVVQIWNSGWDAIEDAYYDADIKQWHSNYNGFPYLFGAVTHWRPSS